MAIVVAKKNVRKIGVLDKAKLARIQNTAIELMTLHGLIAKNWKLVWNNSMTNFGECWCSRRTIYLSTPMMNTVSEEKAKDTILHEIAHALTPGHGHDHIWRDKAIEIGCNGMRCGDIKAEAENEEAYKAFIATKASNRRYVLVCDHCKAEYPRRSFDTCYIQNQETKLTFYRCRCKVDGQKPYLRVIDTHNFGEQK